MSEGEGLYKPKGSIRVTGLMVIKKWHMLCESCTIFCDCYERSKSLRLTLFLSIQLSFNPVPFLYQVDHGILAVGLPTTN